jgi:hypothetical protein
VPKNISPDTKLELMQRINTEQLIEILVERQQKLRERILNCALAVNVHQENMFLTLHGTSDV